MNDELLTYKEVEARLKRGRTYVYQMRKLGLPTIGGRVRWSDVIEFLKNYPFPCSNSKSLNNTEQNRTILN